MVILALLLFERRSFMRYIAALIVFFALATMAYAEDDSRFFSEPIAFELKMISPTTMASEGNPPIPTTPYPFELSPLPGSNSTKSPFHITLDNTFASRYWGSIVGGIFYGGRFVCFTNLTLSLDDSYGSTYVLAGMINPLDTWQWDNRRKPGGTEYYFGIGRTFDLWKGLDGMPLVKINSLIMLDSISPITELRNDLVEEYFRASFPRVPLVEPYVEVYHWDPVGTKSPQTGFFLRAGIHRQQPLGFKLFGTPMELGMDLSIGDAATSIFGTSSGIAYYRGILSTEVRLNEHISIIPAVIGQIPGNQDIGHAFVKNPEAFFNLTVSYKF